MKMERSWGGWIGAAAVFLSIFYLMTARVYTEGSLGESYLLLKPYPSLELEMGGGEEGAWARSHPGQPLPWWQAPDNVRLAYGGDWEDPVIWGPFHTAGYLLTPVLWCSFLGILVWQRLKRKRIDRS
jgi:hypothetical protein